MGYNPNSKDFTFGYLCFETSPVLEQKNISESGYHLHAKRSTDGTSFFVYLSVVHITHEQHIQKLNWNEQEVELLTRPESEGGSGVSKRDLMKRCKSGVISKVYGQQAQIGFESSVKDGEEAPDATDLYFDNTPEGVTALESAYAPYNKFRKSKAGETFISYSPMIEMSLSDKQRDDPALILSTFIHEVIEKSRSSVEFRKGDEISNLFMVEAAPPLR